MTNETDTLVARGLKEEERANIFEEKPVRIEKMFWLPASALDAEALPDDLQEFLESDLPEKKSDPLYKGLPELKQFADANDFEAWDVCYALRGRKGFLFQIASPVITPYGKSYSFSWGYTHIGWLYADDLDGVAKATAKQVGEWQAADRKKHGKKVARKALDAALGGRT